MKNILIPMDFTSVATNALRYGLKLFENSNITVVHATSTVGKNPELFGAKPGETNSSLLQKEIKNLILHELEFRSLPENIEIKILLGEPSDVIRNEVKANSYQAIVMGTRDKYSLFDKWLGTISLSLVKTLDMPIYLIPRYAKYNSIENVIIASESSISTKENLEKIATWNKDYKAFLNFLHIKKNDTENLDGDFYQNVKDYFEQKEVNFGLKISDIQGADVCKNILANAYNMKTDMIMILPDRQSFLNSLVINSISKEMILSSHIPMLFYNS